MHRFSVAPTHGKAAQHEREQIWRNLHVKIWRSVRFQLLLSTQDSCVEQPAVGDLINAKGHLD